MDIKDFVNKYDDWTLYVRYRKVSRLWKEYKRELKFKSHTRISQGQLKHLRRQLIDVYSIRISEISAKLPTLNDMFMFVYGPMIEQMNPSRNVFFDKVKRCDWNTGMEITLPKV